VGKEGFIDFLLIFLGKQLFLGMPSGFWIKEKRLSRGEAQIPSLAQGEGED